jgi:hypothetical protein
LGKLVKLDLTTNRRADKPIFQTLDGFLTGLQDRQDFTTRCRWRMIRGAPSIGRFIAKKNRHKKSNVLDLRCSESAFALQKKHPEGKRKNSLPPAHQPAKNYPTSGRWVEIVFCYDCRIPVVGKNWRFVRNETDACAIQSDI